jgi:RHS repeat-associated protein
MLAYTATGNISSITPSTGVATTMTYNNANRLSSLTNPSQKVSYTYDALGHRIFKTLPGNPNSVYLYGQDGSLQEEINNGVATDYLYMDGVNIANWQPSQHHLYMIITDRLGTPLVSRDEYGLTNWAAYYQPYGGRTVTVSSGQFTGPVTQNKVFPGQEVDATSGLYQNGFRDYIPGLGRYLEADPIGLGGGLNPYLYANANPSGFVDPSGTIEIPPLPPWPGSGPVSVPDLPVLPPVQITPNNKGDEGSGGNNQGRCPGR